MATRIIWGTISPEGHKLSGVGFHPSRKNEGDYRIEFDEEFMGLPAIVGTQTGLDFSGQVPLDGTVFPFLDSKGATAFTSNQIGTLKDRQFSFIAIGEVKE